MVVCQLSIGRCGQDRLGLSIDRTSVAVCAHGRHRRGKSSLHSIDHAFRFSSGIRENVGQTITLQDPGNRVPDRAGDPGQSGPCCLDSGAYQSSDAGYTLHIIFIQRRQLHFTSQLSRVRLNQMRPGENKQCSLTSRKVHIDLSGQSLTLHIRRQ